MLSAVQQLPRPVGLPIAETAAVLSRLRGKRIAHPHGVGLRGTLTPLSERLSGTALGAECAVTGRLSRAIGLPEPLPDLLGLAFRVSDAFGPGLHQDILMASCGSPPLANHLFLPARGFLERPYTTLLPYELHGERIVFEAKAAKADRAGPKLGDLRCGDMSPLEYVLSVRSSGSHPAALLQLESRLGEDATEELAFDPLHTGGGLELRGLINRLRGPAYRGSHAGRGVPQSS